MSTAREVRAAYEGLRDDLIAALNAHPSFRDAEWNDEAASISVFADHPIGADPRVATVLLPNR